MQVKVNLIYSIFDSYVSPRASPAKPTEPKPTAPAGEAKEHTMTGCLQKGTEPGTFVVQNTEAKGPKMIGILESKDKLDPHVGHKIAITGSPVPEKEVATMKTKPAKADHYMKVSAVKMISATCP